MRIEDSPQLAAGSFNYDARYRLKFNSGTVQNEAIRLKGRPVRIRKYGWRMPVFSLYENVVSIKETE